jgi:hypothetical protein
VEEKSPIVLKDGILVYTGEVEGDLETVLQRDRDERSRRLLADLGEEDGAALLPIP